jgi:hypothetical protein
MAQVPQSSRDFNRDYAKGGFQSVFGEAWLTGANAAGPCTVKVRVSRRDPKHDDWKLNSEVHVTLDTYTRRAKFDFDAQGRLTRLEIENFLAGFRTSADSCSGLQPAR